MLQILQPHTQHNPRNVLRLEEKSLYRAKQSTSCDGLGRHATIQKNMGAYHIKRKRNGSNLKRKY